MASDGFNPLNDVSTQAGINELNRMLRELYDNVAGDGNTIKVYNGFGAPTISAGNGSIYMRTDTGKIYVMESGSWTAK